MQLDLPVFSGGNEFGVNESHRMSSTSGCNRAIFKYFEQLSKGFAWGTAAIRHWQIALAGAKRWGVAKPADSPITMPRSSQFSIANDLSAFGRHAPQGIMARLLQWTRASSTNWAGKRRAFFLRKLAVRRLKGAPLDVTAMGAKMRLYPYNNVCEKRILFTPQYFDAAERGYLRQRLVGNFVFIDVGANIGGYTLAVAAGAAPGARILAIEPQPEIFERLVYNIRQNPFPCVKALNCAVADRDGEITLFVDAQNRGETSMRIVNSSNAGQTIRVPARALTHLIAEERFTQVDAMKLDVEGAEDLILEAYFRDAPPKLWPKLLLVEDEPTRWAIDLHALIAGNGYRAVLRTRNNIAYERD